MAPSSSNVVRPTDGAVRHAARLLSQKCARCDGLRVSGSWSAPGGDYPQMWVCLDCQRRLARGVDDESVLGGEELTRPPGLSQFL